MIGPGWAAGRLLFRSTTSTCFSLVLWQVAVMIWGVLWHFHWQMLEGSYHPSIKFCIFLTSHVLTANGCIAHLMAVLHILFPKIPHIYVCLSKLHGCAAKQQIFRLCVIVSRQSIWKAIVIYYWTFWVVYLEFLYHPVNLCMVYKKCLWINACPFCNHTNIFLFLTFF